MRKCLDRAKQAANKEEVAMAGPTQVHVIKGKKDQRLQVVKAKTSGGIEVVGSPEEWKTIEEIFAAGWSIRQMVQIEGPFVLLLLEKDAHGGGAWAAKNLPF
jgi:hypothetical protein